MKRGPNVIAPKLQPPFLVLGANNVFLETIKRGENDSFGSKKFDRPNKSTTTTVILRLYEAFGGHAQVRLEIGRQFPVTKAYVTNLLEDEDQKLDVMLNSTSDGPAAVVKLDFRGFEVKTVKLVIGHESGHA
jgi:alpha-mannosidase